MVKLFCYSASWNERHGAERGALALVATDPDIATLEEFATELFAV
ncbi:MAG: hypothetical protein ACRDWI_14265 [Jiangellaceae bacterium]